MLLTGAFYQSFYRQLNVTHKIYVLAFWPGVFCVLKTGKCTVAMRRIGGLFRAKQANKKKGKRKIMDKENKGNINELIESIKSHTDGDDSDKCEENEERSARQEKRVYCVEEIAEILRIGKSSAYALVNSGQFSIVKIGSAIRISKKSFDEWLERGCEKVAV